MHNKTVKNPQLLSQTRICNCVNKPSCPLHNKWCNNNGRYKAIITLTADISETKFKTWYANHQKSFKKRKYKIDTELLNEMWKLREQNKNVDIWLEILWIHQSYNTVTKRCMLRLNETIAIALHKEDSILNKYSEVISKCRHSKKYSLVNYDTKD